MAQSLFPFFDRLATQSTRWRLSPLWPSDSRDSKQRSLLHLLSVAHRDRLDVATLVRNLADEHRGSYRRRLSRLSRRLAEGTPLVEALEQTPDVLADESVLAIRFGTQTGTLNETYRHLVESPDAASDRAEAMWRQSMIYAGVSLIVLGLALAFLAVFIFPVLQKMQQEFQLLGTDISPWTLGWLIAACDHLVDHAPLWILASLVAAWLLWSAPSRRFFRRFIAGRWMRGVAQARASELLRLLALAVEAGRPLPSAISTLARYHFDKSVRQKLLLARNEIEQGADLWDSLTGAKLLTPQESRALANSSSDRSQVWAMRRLADWKQTRNALRHDNLIVMLQPTVTLVIASVVLLAGSAMIGFLAHMILSLA